MCIRDSVDPVADEDAYRFSVENWVYFSQAFGSLITLEADESTVIGSSSQLLAGADRSFSVGINNEIGCNVNNDPNFVAPADSFTVGNNTINDSPNTLSVGNFAQIPASSEGAVVVGNGSRRTLGDLTNPISALPGNGCLLYTSPSPRDRTRSRMPSSA